MLVVLWHIVTTPTGGPPKGNFFDATPLYKALWFAMFGPQMVWLFLMISGFALYWSEASRRLRGQHPTGLRTYGLRRAWRIVPTYYVALAFSLVLLLVGRPFYLPPVETATGSLPITWGGFVSHLFFLQNVKESWQPQINPSLWSLAFEVQIYLLFPLMLVRWKRAALYVGAVFIVVNHWAMAWFVRPDFVVSDFFVVGVWLAIWLREEHREVPNAVLNGIAFLFIAVPAFVFPIPIDLMKSEPFWLIGFTALIIRLHRANQSRRNLVTHPWTLRLGDISYSLYAMHFTLILAAWWFVGRLPVTFNVALLLLFVVALPIVFAVTHVTYGLIERPSLAKSQATRDPDQVPTTASAQ